MYCYSGGTWAASLNFAAKGYPDFYMLDISHDFTRSGALNGWLNQTPTGNYALEPNWDFSLVTIPDHTFVTNGGIGYGIPTAGHAAQRLLNATTKFDGQSWYTIPTSETQGQYFGESGNYIESKNSIYYWGGWNLLTNSGPTTAFRVLDYSSPSWSTYPVATFPENAIPRYQHTATMAGDKKIYFIGGSDGYVNNHNISMNDILIYDTIADKWELKQAEGGYTPSYRVLHTTTWIPGTNTLLMYGGGVNSAQFKNLSTVTDYCYKYDTVGNKWSPQVLDGTGGAGERYGHSAVLIGNSTMFILFGIGPNPFDNGEKDFYILDLNKMAWTENYAASALNYIPPDTTSNSNSSIPHTTPSSTAKPSNTSTIIGAVVGCVVAVLIGAVIAIFVYRRKKKAGQADRFVHEDQPIIHDHKNNEPGLYNPHIYAIEPQSKVYLRDEPQSKVYLPGEPQSKVFLSMEQRNGIGSTPTLMSESVQPQSFTVEKPDSRDGHYNAQLQAVKPDAVIVPKISQ
ncbi:hypothetical protein DFQ29_006114 [Apophysomyces sp. BC1021]|nr:hypothetical protein DFQ29_006114 [Apophysomyces sp. BC1021]